MIKFLIELVVIFFLLFLLYYFFIIRKCKNNKGYVPVEVNLILSKYNINLEKVNLYKMIKTVSLVTTFIIALAISIITNFFDSTILSIVFATLLSVLLFIIIYNFIGQYYEKKSLKTKK